MATRGGYFGIIKRKRPSKPKPPGTLTRTTVTPYPGGKPSLDSKASLPSTLVPGQAADAAVALKKKTAMQEAMLKGQRMKSPKPLTAAQRKLVAGAKPKAKAQRSAAEIAAMKAYRAIHGRDRDQGPPVSRGADAARLNAMMDRKQAVRRKKRRLTGPIAGEAIKRKKRKKRGGTLSPSDY